MSSGEGRCPVERSDAPGGNETLVALRPGEEDAALLIGLADRGDLERGKQVVLKFEARSATAPTILGKLGVGRLHPPAGKDERARGEVDLVVADDHEDFEPRRPIAHEHDGRGGARRGRRCLLAHARARSLSLSLKRWILPVAVFGNSATNSIARGYLKGASRSLTKLFSSASSAVLAGFEHDEGLRLDEAVLVGRADDGGFEHRRVLDDGRLDLERAHIDAADLQHVVAPAGVGEAAVGIADVLVAALGPAALEGFARLGAVPPVHERRRRPLDEEVAGLAVLNAAAVLGAELDVVARHRPAGRAVTHLVRPVGDEDVQHLGRADAVDDVDAEMAPEALADLGRQRLARPRRRGAARPRSRAGRAGEASMPAKRSGRRRRRSA